MKKRDEILQNRAELANNPANENFCDHCGETMLFAMKDNYHEFSIGLKTILSCLKLAEQEGHVPELPKGWWHELDKRHC